jgi:predicted N-formylglutamate amidohydrolase
MPLLCPADGPAFEILNPEAPSGIVISCEHARNRIPQSLGDLGVAAHDLADHIGWDPGAEGVARLLSQRFNTGLALGGFSRLVFDLNRSEDDPTAIPEISDGRPIPGNRSLTAAQKKERADTLLYPYHAAVDAMLDRVKTRDQVPVFISVHSFTPTMRGFDRPWDIGLLWGHDDRLTSHALNALHAMPELCIGENEPYSLQAEDPCYTIDRHAEDRGLPYLMIEVKNSHLQEEAGIQLYAEYLGDAIEKALKDQAHWRSIEQK